MCDYFWQRMENSQGDLTDIIRNSSLAGSPETSNFSDNLQLLPEPTTAFVPPVDTFKDPFADIRSDPLFDELAGASFFSSPETAVTGGGGVVQKMLLGEEGNVITSSCLFSSMLQISPVTSKALPVIGSPQPLMAPAVDHGGDLQISSPRVQGIKRRKSQVKKVVCIPAPAAAGGRSTGEAVPSDLWAWRKYGQKPIKGSPYPRGYYRCSSSKGCSARKQVERSRTDPNMLVITYTSEHNHPWPTQRNALAGSTRSQPSKGNNASTSKCSPPNQNQSTNMIKEEPKECSSSSNQVVKEEALEMEDRPLIDPQDHDFHSVFDESFNEHMMPMESDQPNNFFEDLAELEPEPMNLIFPKGFMGDKLDEERDNNKAMDPFCVFDWGGGN